jgi:hypothetical protein
MGGTLNRARDRSTLPVTLLVTVLGLAAVASASVASMPWLRAYQVAGAPLLLVLASALPFGISALVSRWLRFPAVLSYASSVAGLVALLAVSNHFSFSSAWDGFAHVPAQLLSVTLPLSGDNGLLAAPVALSWLCAAASAELLLRPARPAPSGLAVPVACFALSFAATTSGPPGATVTEGAVLFGTLVVAALARQGLLDAQLTLAQAVHGPETAGRGTAGRGTAGRGTAGRTAGTLRSAAGPRPHRRGSLRRGLTGGALALALAGALAPSVPDLPAFASRPVALARPTQLLARTVVDPVDKLASVRDSGPAAPPRNMLSVEVHQPWNGYVSMATLNTYDGDSWSFSATFRPTGGRVPGTPGDSTPGATGPGARAVTQDYTIEQPLDMPFLPALDRPVQVSGLAVDADPVTGMLAASVPVPASYTVTSRAPLVTAAELPSASGLEPGPSVPGGDSTAYTALPPGSTTDVAAAVRFATNLAGQPASPSLAFVQALTASLRAQERRAAPSASPGGQPAPTALAGTSLAQVINAITVDEAATPEQFATFVAVVARYIGIPVRVVTGFRAPAAAGTSAPLPPGRYQLTDRDAWTWDEIPVLGYGWVVVDATPLASTTDISAPPEQVKARVPSKPGQATAVPGSSGGHAIAKHVRVTAAPPQGIDWPVLVAAGIPALGILALLIGGFGAPAVRRRLRRLARHHSGDPALLATGAWLELIDGLHRLGIDVAASATGTDVVARVAGRFGQDFVRLARDIATLADQALYSTRWPVDGAQAKLAWESQHRLYRSLRRQVGRSQRTRALWLVGTSPARPASPASPASPEQCSVGGDR